MDIFNKIEKTYLDRVNDSSLHKSFWNKLVKEIPPGYMIGENPRPSLKIAMESGDLGLALNWIVQSALLRGQITELLLYIEETSPVYSLLTSIKDNNILALAHSEDKSSPVIISHKGADMILTGRKKYISSGPDADYILLTCRREGEGKISDIVFIPVEKLDKSNFTDLKLPALKSLSHSSLSLNNFKLSDKFRLEIPGKDIRRVLKKWSILERSMIVEAYLGLIIYLNRKSNKILKKEIISEEVLMELLKTAENIVNNQVKAAMERKFIEKGELDHKLISYITKNIIKEKEKFSSSKKNMQQFSDLEFIGSFYNRG